VEISGKVGLFDFWVVAVAVADVIGDEEMKGLRLL